MLVYVASLLVQLALSPHLGLNGDVWGGVTRFPSRIFLLVIGILTATSSLPVYVAHGLTRREFAMGAGLFALLVGGLFALVILAGYLIQPWGGLGEFVTRQPLLLLALHEVLLLAIWFLNGALIGTGFYRRRVAGMLAILLAAALVLAAEASAAGNLAWALAWSTPAAEFASGAFRFGILLLGLMVNYGTVREIALRGSQS